MLSIRMLMRCPRDLAVWTYSGCNLKHHGDEEPQELIPPVGVTNQNDNGTQSLKKCSFEKGLCASEFCGNGEVALFKYKWKSKQ